MIIVCNGYVDKRAVVYSLIKLLSEFGDVAVITQNKQLLRLLEDEATFGHYNNTFVVVSESISDDLFNEIDYKKEDFDFIIYDTYNSYPNDYDMFIHCRSFGVSAVDRQIIENVSGVNQINFTYDGRKDMGCFNIQIALPLLKSVEEFEAKKLMVSIENSDLIKILSRIFANKLGVTEKNVTMLLKKGWK